MTKLQKIKPFGHSKAQKKSARYCSFSPSWAELPIYVYFEFFGILIPHAVSLAWFISQTFAIFDIFCHFLVFSCYVSDLISGWDWAKLLPFSKHIPPSLPVRQWSIKILELGWRQQHFVEIIFFWEIFRNKKFCFDLILWFCVVRLPGIGPIDIALWVDWKDPNLHKTNFPFPDGFPLRNAEGSGRKTLDCLEFSFAAEKNHLCFISYILYILSLLFYQSEEKLGSFHLLPWRKKTSLSILSV